MTLIDILHVYRYGATLELDATVESRIRKRDTALAAQPAPVNNAIRNDDRPLSLEAYKDFLLLEPGLHFPFVAVAPRRAARAVMLSLIILHVNRKDARGTDILLLLIRLLNAEIYPELIFSLSADDPRLALRSVAYCLIGDSKVHSRGRLEEADKVLSQRGLATLPRTLVDSANIFHDDALILASCLESFESIGVAEAVQRKLVRIAGGIEASRNELRASTESLDRQRRKFLKSIEISSTVELLGTFSISFKRAKSALSQHLDLPPDDNPLSLEQPCLFEDVIVELILALLDTAKRSSEDVMTLARHYHGAVKKWKKGKSSIRRLEEIAAVLEMDVRGQTAAAKAFKRTDAVNQTLKVFEQMFVLGELKRAVATWEKLLAVEAIVLAECLWAGPWHARDPFSSFLDLMEEVSPHKGRADRPPDMEVIRVAQHLISLLELDEDYDNPIRQ
jgi:hypothetical protein